MASASESSDKIVPSGEYRGARSTGIVFHDQSAVYIAIPKVACTSLKTAFAPVLGVEGDVHFEGVWPEISLDELEAGRPGLFIFAFVRNPWDRLLSCYTSKVHHGRDDYYYRDGVEFNFWKYGDQFTGDMSFEDFVDATASIPDEEADIHFSSQHRHLVGADGESFADFVGRFESLADDFASVCARLGLTGAVLPHLYQTEHGHYSTHYTERTRRLVERRWAEDIERFEYRFEPRERSRP